MSGAPTHFIALVLSMAGSGCYLSHGLGDGSERHDGGRGTEPAPRRDASTPRPVDAAVPIPLPPTVDASLPPIDEPDVDPDERPSDDPGAGTWTDPPAPSSDPCCDVGEVVGLDDPTRQASAPVVAWARGEWGVAWADLSAPALPGEPSHALFARLDPDARALAPLRTIAGVGSPLALTYVSGRYALGVTLPSGWPEPDTSYLGVLDSHGALVDVTVVPGRVGRIERFPAAHAWMVTTFLPDGDGSHASWLRAYDDALSSIGAPIALGEIMADHAPQLVALKNRLVAILPTREGVMQITFARRELERAGEGLLMRPGTYVTERGESRIGVAVAATAMRDSAVVVAMDRTDLWVAAYDPFSGEIVHAPSTFARSPADGGHGVAADPEGGTIGVCYPDGEGPYGGYVNVMGEGRDATRSGPPDADSIRFALLGPDGAPLGAPVTIATGLRYVAACAVAAAGRDRYVVAFWNAAWSTPPRHSILAARVSVRR